MITGVWDKMREDTFLQLASRKSRLDELLGRGLVEVRYGQKFSVAGRLSFNDEEGYSVNRFKVPLTSVVSFNLDQNPPLVNVDENLYRRELN